MLDTQILIWALQEPNRINHQVKLLIDDLSNSLHVSCISFFEIEQKKKIGKLQFEHDSRLLISSGYFRIIDLSFEHCYRTKELPLIHKDPFDRLLIAQSMVEEMPLVTSDKYIHQYDFSHIKA